MNTHVPALGGKRYSRNGQQPRQPAVRPSNNPEVLRLQRQVEKQERQIRFLQGTSQDSATKLARAEAEQIVNQLEGEGIIFGETPQEHARERAETVQFLSVLDRDGQNFEVNKIRRHYKRKESDPANPAMIGAARYARNPNGAMGNDDEYDPQTPQEAMEYAELQTGPKKMSREDAIKYMRRRQQTPRR